MSRAPTCYCGAETALRSSKFGRFYGCTRWPACDGLVGCHKGTDRPLGTVAPPVTREARHAAHEAFDALRREVLPPGAHARREAYRWLAEALGVHEADAHMGTMDLATATRVVAICRHHGAAAHLRDYVRRSTAVGE